MYRLRILTSTTRIAGPVISHYLCQASLTLRSQARRGLYIFTNIYIPPTERLSCDGRWSGTKAVDERTTQAW